MLHEDNRMNSTPSLASSSSSFIRPPSSRSVTTSVYTTQFDEDEDPWGDFPTTDKATASQPSTLNDPYNGKKENEVSDVAFDLVTIPPFYHRLYKNLYNGNGVDLSSLHKVISASGISNTQGQQILNLIGKAQLLSEREFYGFLVCVALAQRHEDITVVSINACRFDPPVPRLDINQEESDEEEEVIQNQYNTNTQPSTGSNEPYETFVNIDKPDSVTVQIAPEKEGYIFKHVKYIVQNNDIKSRVLRRYNDFSWLAETITRRYPSRMIPNLPPKNLGGRTDAFLEKRRKALSRFLNALLRHPILRNDEIVHVFFTEPSELGAWKKQNVPSLEDEFFRLQIREESANATQDWEERFEKATQRNEVAVKTYTEMCLAMERMAKRQTNQAKDYMRYGTCLSSLSELENFCYSDACQRRCRQVRLDSELVAKHLQKARVQLQNSSDVIYSTTLEQLKRQRDLCLSFKDLCSRKNRYWGNMLEVLEKRVNSNTIKANQNRGIPGMENEVQKLDVILRQDNEAIIKERKRRQYIAKSIKEEIRYLQDQESYALILHRNFTQIQAQSEKNMYEIWNELQNKLEG
ncbi:hypothetical protein INT44_003523 [Umbelopsis vinacea]|uniref:Sorting nexin MVP1 n=1 Tax=Umbelopsis vinacea TaxID=44442 RepID=A0A8H7UIQ4_9FUNG|nr:hypothetical protein INT44_003523 [Umbelopsis vinacea]